MGPGIAARYVVAAPAANAKRFGELAAPEIAALLDGHAASPRAAAVRETIRWHPDPANIDAFGPGRCMFGSDYPVSRRRMGYAELCTCFREVAAEHAPSEQHALFYGTAARLYGIAP